MQCMLHAVYHVLLNWCCCAVLCAQRKSAYLYVLKLVWKGFQVDIKALYKGIGDAVTVTAESRD